MNYYLIRTVLAAAFLRLIPAAASAAQEVGQKAESFQLKDTNGKEHSLSAYAGRIVVLEFWSFKCPVSLAYRDRMAALQQKYQAKGVAFLAIASSKNESPPEVARNAANLNMPYPVLLDTDGIVADKLGATRAPSIFILDGGGVLRYRGAVDNNKTPGEGGRTPFAEEAIEALLAGRPVSPSETREFGCTIRRIGH